MISRDSIALAENIAAHLGADQVVPASPLLAGLNEESYGALAYTPEGWREQIADVTGDTTSHSVVMEAGTTRMAEIIRGSFEMVKTYGIPLATAIADGVSLLYTPERLSGLSSRELCIRFANVDDPFFHSSIYPTEVRNTALNFDGIGLEVLERLEFNWVNGETIKEFLATSHPEVLAIIDNKDCSMEYAAEVLTGLGQLKDKFHCTEGGAFDFTRVKSIDINLIMKMYIIASKMYASEKPVDWLMKGSLEDYRAFVELIWNGLTVYLINLKKIAEIYRGRKLTIVDNKSIDMVTITPSEELGVALKVLSADVIVYFTNEVLKEAEGLGVSLADVVIACLLARVSGKNVAPTDMLANKELVQEVLGTYHSSLHNSMEGRSHEYFHESALRAMAKFVTENEAAQQALMKTTGGDGTSVLTLIREGMSNDIEKLFHLFSSGNNTYSGGAEIRTDGTSPERERCITAVLQTKVVPNFLRLLGCDLAAEILEITYVSQEVEDNLVGQRQRLHAALIEMLAGKLVG